ncbi:hypothetical protein MATL_G00221490 [Megalops atlanticus]|uniref:NACHT, LRR and PYD domains-containing protein 12-like n=1 Tax=Megalops atlanticus TaxID=7932 RepID=A0A9D3PGD1_MEGAT|nr:hypothetical protein MATL_G00221490 [Megalops atlanticus]
MVMSCCGCLFPRGRENSPDLRDNRGGEEKQVLLPSAVHRDQEQTQETEEKDVPSLLLDSLDNISSDDLKRFRFHLRQGVPGYKPILWKHLENADRTDTMKAMLEHYSTDGALMVTLHILRKMNLNNEALTLERKIGRELPMGGPRPRVTPPTPAGPIQGDTTDSEPPPVRPTQRDTTDSEPHPAGSSGGDTTAREGNLADELLQKTKKDLQTKFKNKYEGIFEGIARRGNRVQLTHIFTDIYITEGESEEVNTEHEVRQIEALSKTPATQETAIGYNDIFNILPGKELRVRTVLMKGFAGIGKTVSVQKFILDWAEGKANKDISLIFPLPFRELNLMKERFSLLGLIQHYHPEMKGSESIDLNNRTVLFIFDGLDECRLPLDFQNNGSCYDVTESTSVDVLLTNLIKGNLLPSALIWITTRPAAANQIPPECIHRMTEEQGQAEDESSSEEEEDFSESYEQVEETEERTGEVASAPIAELHRSAVDQALQSHTGHLDLFLRFLLGISLDSNQALLKGLLTQTESSSQSIKETVRYIKDKIRKNPSPERTINLFHCLSELQDHSLVEDIQRYLESSSLSEKKLTPDECSALAYVLLMSERKLELLDLKMYNTTPAGRHRLLPVVKYCEKAHLYRCNLTAESCEPVLSALHSPNSHLRDLDLSFNDLEDSGVKLFCVELQKPQRKLRSLRLVCCKLTGLTCDLLASALQSADAQLKELDLSCNSLGDAGVKRLCAGALNQLSKLETLGLRECNLTEGCCADLASVLRSHHSDLRELELRDNDLQDSGVRALSAGLEDPHCKLQRLGLSGCRVTEEGCASLAAALHLNPSHLRELDLSYNHPGDSGVRALSAGLEDRSFKLQAEHCGEGRNRPGLQKYACHLTLDPNTAARELRLSEGDRKATAGVYLDRPAGALSFYSVSSSTVTLLHTFHAAFAGPLYPGVWVQESSGSVTLCSMG